MPKVKVPRKSTSVDMTAMTDVAFLLLTFFMLATKFKPDEPVIVDTPSSISETKLPDVDMMMISIDKENRVFFGIDGQQKRDSLLDMISAKYKVAFTESEKKEFSLISAFGVPVAQLKQFLSLPSAERSKIKQPGIPSDSLNNELGDWIWFSRLVNKNIRVAVKGDQSTSFPVVKQVMNTLQDKKMNKFNFITTLERGAE
ncbi:MAG: biopolymer transporter ExbD [Bacteroidota bacterium]